MRPRLDTRIPPAFRPLAEWTTRWSAATAGVAASYVGGSLATDRVDDLSDLDVVVVTVPGTREEVFDALLAGLARDWEVVSRWVREVPTWHGGLQVFAQVRPAGDTKPPLIIDAVVDDVRPRWVEVDEVRHGRPVVLHDPEGLVVTSPDDPEAAAEAAARAVRTIHDRLPVAEWLVLKAVHRGHWPEAYASYLQVGIDALVQLLRVRHCPRRWDYGLRYLDSDLPEDVRARVVALLPEAREHLEAQAKAAFAWQRELLEELTAPDS